MLLDDASQHRGLAFQQRRRPLDPDRLANGADLQLHIDLRSLIDLKFHAGAFHFAKTLNFRRQLVAAGLQAR